MTAKPSPGRSAERYRFDRFELQPAARRLLVEGREAKLGARAFDVLLTLVERPGRVVSKDELFAAVWPGVVVEEANLAVQISALRKQLGAGLIATVAGRGYQFTATLEPVNAGAEPAAAGGARAAALAGAPGAAPRAASAMLGRAAELAALSGLLAGQRLVTVTGPGGIGKTRLAQAWCEGPGAGQRVAWVDLSGLADALQLASAVSALSVPFDAARAEAATPGASTLVLDNAEPMAAEVAAFAQQWLDAAPRRRLLVTSQVPLRLQAEHVLRLGTLPVPPTRATPAQALAHAAVVLFVERARAADPQFELAEGNVTSVVEVCRRLDGLPLALELAAARVATIGVNALAAALGAALDGAVGVETVEARRADGAFESALGEGRRDAPARQRTLTAALAWSHALLDAAARRVFRRLGVFSGGFTLAAAQAVAGDGPEEAWGLMSTLGRLVEHSLVAKDGAEPPRFGLLESARLFALEQLERAGETMVLRGRHLAWCRALVHDAVGAAGAGPLEPAAAARVTLEYANVRAALGWALAPGSGAREAGAALAVALLPYWQHIEADDEHRRWAARLPASPGAPPPDAAAGARPDGAPADTASAGAATAQRVLERLRSDDLLAAGAGLGAEAVFALARRAGGGSVRHLDEAVHELERAVALAAAVRGRGGDAAAAAPGVVDDVVDDVLREAARCANEGEGERALALLDGAAAELGRRAAGQREPMQRAGRALLGAALPLALAQGDSAAVVRHVEALAALEEPGRPSEAPAWREHEALLLARGLDEASMPALTAAVHLLRQRLALARPGGSPPRDDWQDIALALARALNRLALDDGADARRREAIGLCEQALAATPRQAAPSRWSALHHEWARALGHHGVRGGSAALLEEALMHSRLALQERARETDAHAWAEAMAQLASLELHAARFGAGTSGLEAAVQAGRQSLLVWTCEEAPARWAMVQSTIATALSHWAQREAGDASMARRHEAVAAYRAALGVLSPERTPREWAGEQCNLGIELAAIGEWQPGPEGIESLQAAVDAYREALRALSFEHSPAPWAAVQHNLGGALRLLGERERGTQSLREAVLAFDEALRQHTRERAPGHWAAGQNDRALALLALGRREGRRERIAEAATALRAALLERRRDSAPLDWARTQCALADTLAAGAELEDDPAQMAAAAAAAEAALCELTEQVLPEDHRQAARRLAQARAWLAAREGGRP